MQSKFEKQIQLFPKTLVPEFFNLFGEQVTNKLLTVFAGTTIRVPSTRDQQNAFRDIHIYESLCNSGSSSETKEISEKLSKQYKISRRHIRAIYKSMRKLSKLNRKLREEDIATGQHRVKHVNVKPKTKLRGM